MNITIDAIKQFIKETTGVVTKLYYSEDFNETEYPFYALVDENVEVSSMFVDEPEPSFVIETDNGNYEGVASVLLFTDFVDQAKLELSSEGIGNGVLVINDECLTYEEVERLKEIQTSLN